MQPALGLQPPVWVDDADFDLTYHLRHLALAPPGDERDLFDLATLLTADPFDRTRPLWQMVIIEGLSGGRAALLMRFHHTLMDGEGGVRLSLQFLDFERDAPEKPVPPAPTPRRASAARERGRGRSRRRDEHAARARSASPREWTRARREPAAHPRDERSGSDADPRDRPPALRHEARPCHRCGPLARCPVASRRCERRSTT